MSILTGRYSLPFFKKSEKKKNGNIFFATSLYLEGFLRDTEEFTAFSID